MGTFLRANQKAGSLFHYILLQSPKAHWETDSKVVAIKAENDSTTAVKQ